MTFGVRAGVRAGAPGGIELFGAELSDGRVGDGCVGAGEVVVRGGELGVSVGEGQLLVRCGLEADAALAHFELDGGDGQGWVVAVADCDVDLGGALKIGAEGCGDAELLLVDFARGFREFDALDGSGDGVA